MEAEDLLDKYSQEQGFGNWNTVVLNCAHSVITSVAIASVNEALLKLRKIEQGKTICFADQDQKGVASPLKDNNEEGSIDID